MPVETGFVPGAPAPAPMLEMFMKPALIPPENFLGNIIFPDAQVSDFEGIAPVTGNEVLEVFEDDIAAFRGDFPEVQFSQEETKWGMGYHGRKIIIDHGQIMKAKRLQALSRGLGLSNADALFNVESRATNLITAQNIRRNEMVKMNVLKNTASYASGNVFDPVEIDTISATDLLKLFVRAAKTVDGYGRGPANFIAWGDGAWDGVLSNAALATDLLPETAFKIMTTDAFLPALKLPEGQSTSMIASAMYKETAQSDPKPMFDRYIWIGRVGQQDGTDRNFGANLWHPCEQNNQRYYVNRLTVGNIENIHIAVQNFYQVFVNNNALAVLIPITLSTDT